MNQVIDALLMAAQKAVVAERRTESRHALVRPVQISLRDQDSCSGFSKDLSRHGIGVIVDRDLAIGTIATLSIHSLSSQPAHLRCELRWSDPFGKGWWLSGWKFYSIAAPGTVVRRL